MTAFLSKQHETTVIILVSHLLSYRYTITIGNRALVKDIVRLVYRGDQELVKCMEK